MSKTIAFSLAVLALAGLSGVLSATNEGPGGSDGCPMAGRPTTQAPTAAGGAACQAGKAGAHCPINPAALAGKLDGALHNLGEAQAAIQAGEKEKALKVLAEVRVFLEDLNKTVKPMASPTPLAAEGVVNDRCPVMGGKIDPGKVPAGLTREFKGQKVGFCCGGCPATWDKLPEPEKQAKLDKVKIGN